MTTIVEPMYGTSEIANVDAIHSHHLSVFFIFLASSFRYESDPSATFYSEQYHALSRAALALNPISVEKMCATVQALFMICRFMWESDRASGEERWILFAICSRIAQMVFTIPLFSCSNTCLPSSR